MKAVLYPLIRLESARKEARGTDERARGRGKGQTPVWGRAHAARDPPSAHGHSASTSASAVLDFSIPCPF